MLGGGEGRGIGILGADLLGPGPRKGDMVTILIQLWRPSRGWGSYYKSNHKQSTEHLNLRVTRSAMDGHGGDLEQGSDWKTSKDV